MKKFDDRFIEVVDRNGDGGFLIHNDKTGNEVVKELLKDPRYILQEETNGKTKRVKKQEASG